MDHEIRDRLRTCSTICIWTSSFLCLLFIHCCIHDCFKSSETWISHKRSKSHLTENRTSKTASQRFPSSTRASHHDVSSSDSDLSEDIGLNKEEKKIRKDRRRKARNQRRYYQKYVLFTISDLSFHSFSISFRHRIEEQKKARERAAKWVYCPPYFYITYT